jgi:hypothetical protein
MTNTTEAAEMTIMTVANQAWAIPQLAQDIAGQTPTRELEGRVYAQVLAHLRIDLPGWRFTPRGAFTGPGRDDAYTAVQQLIAAATAAAAAEHLGRA